MRSKEFIIEVRGRPPRGFSWGGPEGEDGWYNGDDKKLEYDPNDYPCIVCGSIIAFHHTPDCDHGEEDAVYDLPTFPKSIKWNGEIPKGLKTIPGLYNQWKSLQLITAPPENLKDILEWLKTVRTKPSIEYISVVKPIKWGINHGIDNIYDLIKRFTLAKKLYAKISQEIKTTGYRSNLPERFWPFEEPFKARWRAIGLGDNHLLNGNVFTDYLNSFERLMIVWQEKGWLDNNKLD